MRIDGRCHCGEVRFEAEVDPDSVAICHCSDCQMLSGTAFRTSVQAPAASFAVRGDSLRTYVKTADSGRKRRQGFCGTCGSSIYSCAFENPQHYTLRLGTIAQRAALTPRRQIWRRSALPWVGLSDIPAADKE